MTIVVRIKWEREQPSPSLEREGQDGLEDDLTDWVIGKSRALDNCFNEVWERWIAVELVDEGRLPGLVAFLRGWGVPRETQLAVRREHEGDEEARHLPLFP